MLVLLSAGPAIADVRRCEDPSGHITYSNESCPTGTAHERPVEERPAVQVAREPGSDKALHSGKVVVSAPVPGAQAPGAAGRSEEVTREQRKALATRCDDLVRRIEYAQQDLLAAGPAERASVELGLRRMQDEHEANCAPRN